MLLRNAFLSGLMLLAPLFVTCWVLFLLFENIGGIFRPLFQRFVPETIRDYDILWNILSTLIALLLITLLGVLSRYVLGKYFGGLAERFIQTIPGVNTVYNTVQQLVSTFSTPNRNVFSKVVLVEFPRKGVHTIGFLTSKTQGEAQERAGRELWSVFVPTTPNPTGGYFMLFPRDEIVELDMSVGDGMKFVISGGAVVPPWTAGKKG
jgi:uncharacterized membrane protein